MFCLCHFETLASPALHGEYCVHETKPFQPWRSSWATIIWIANRCLTEFLRQPVGGGNEAGAFMKRCKGGIWIIWECANGADISTAFKKWEEKSIKHSITNCDIASIQGHQIFWLNKFKKKREYYEQEDSSHAPSTLAEQSYIKSTQPTTTLEPLSLTKLPMLLIHSKLMAQSCE